MNKRQKIVQQQFIDNEEAVIKRLKQVYKKADEDLAKSAKDFQDEINSLDEMINLTDDAEELAVLQSRKQSKIYQQQYNEAMRKQVSGILDTMQSEEFKTVDAYLRQCYEEGFLGTMYDLQGQGIPLCFPMDQEAMVRAVQLDSKISQGLYTRLGEDVSLLKKKITAQVSRGIATGMSYQQIASQLAGYTKIGFNNAIRIARTEGHRIQCQGTMDACYKAKEKGADVVKQWDSTLDAKTRDSHVAVDMEIKELDEKFSNGLMFPGDPSGSAAEVCNCRCALLQRARWAVGGKFTKMNNETGELVDFKNIDDYNKFKKEYLNKSKTLTNDGKNDIISTKNGNLKPYTKVKVEDIPSMDESRFNTMKKNLEKNGVSIIQDADGDAYLEYMGAEAMTLSNGSAVIFQSGRIPSASAMFEETIHVTQIRKKGMIENTSAKKANVEYLRREIDANEKLLKYSEAYGLTDKDIESVQENLDLYYEKLKKGE